MNIGASIDAVAGAAFKAAGAIFGNVPASGKFVVDHDNVLAAAKIIQTQVDDFRSRIENAVNDLPVDPPGYDVVSERLAIAWNEKLVWNADSYTARIDDYIVGLNNLVAQLIDSAKGYGYSEEDIAAALGSEARA